MKIDFSQLQTFIECPKCYYNRYIRKLKKIIEDEREVDMNFGGKIHKALEVFYKDSSKEEALKVFNESFIPLAGDKIRTPQHGTTLLTNYFNYYAGKTNELGDTYMITLAVETVDSFLIGDIEWLVKIDRIVKTNAGIFVLDHKCTQKSLYTFINKFTPSMQVSGYVAYVEQKYGQCSGFIPNVLYFGFRKRAYKGEPAGFHCQFQRDIVNRTKEQIEDFKNNVISWVEKLKQAELDMLWSKNESQCSRCGYKELCISCDDENVQETLYQVVDDPLSYLKGE